MSLNVFLELLIYSHVAFQYGNRYGEFFDKNHEELYI